MCRWFAFATLAGALLLCAQQTRDLRLESGPAPNLLHDKGTRWAVVIGISNHENLPPAAQLHFAHRDAQEFAAFLRSASGGAIPGAHIRLLVNEQATLAEIRASLHTWLVAAAKPDDVVYFFFAGHGVVDTSGEGYFVAYDSDPQNLHATALTFQEVDRTLAARLRAGLVVLVTDACHAGRLGWSSYSPSITSAAAEPISKIGQGDRSFLKLLASSSSERSFEDERWDGGHGVFTDVLLEALSGSADRDGDHLVEASEAVDYVARIVPQRTGALQHPRVAGTFDARLPLAISNKPAPLAAGTVPFDISGPSGSAIYLDNIFRGIVRSSGSLRIDALHPGTHAFSADFPDGATLDGSVILGTLPAHATIVSPAGSALGQLRLRIRAGQILEPNGAWDFYRSRTFAGAEAASASALITGALEGLGQACVNDYVQSTAAGPKAAMLERAVTAYDRLLVLQPNDSGLELRKLFCQGRVQIAQQRFAEAVVTLERAQRMDPRFACTYNALGVVYSQLERPQESRRAFETAAKLTPEWGLPVFQIASQLAASGNLVQARPYLEKAVAYNPRSIEMRWNLLALDRRLGRLRDVEKDAAELIRMNPSYAPTYIELGRAYESAGNTQKAAESYETYLQLAPNFSDSTAVRQRAQQLRGRK